MERLFDAIPGHERVSLTPRLLEFPLLTDLDPRTEQEL